MNFSNVSEAKEYVNKATNTARTLEEIESSISYFKGMLENTKNDEAKELWLAEINDLECWKANSDFIEGNYPQGLDELILEIIEWRAIIYALENVDIVSEPRKQSGFFAQWNLGAVYGIFIIIGKLVSKDPRDNSLRKLWENVSPTMLQDSACTHSEVDYINQKLHHTNGRFTNTNSNVVLFRNKTIAHNEAMPVVIWEEVDQGMSLLIRMWSLLVAWSSFGLNQPFRSETQAFSGMESLFSDTELSKLKAKRKTYLDNAVSWSKNYAHTGTEDNGRGAFSSIKLKVSVIPIESTPNKSNLVSS